MPASWHGILDKIGFFTIESLRPTATINEAECG